MVFRLFAIFVHVLNLKQSFFASCPLLQIHVINIQMYFFCTCLNLRRLEIAIRINLKQTLKLFFNIIFPYPPKINKLKKKSVMFLRNGRFNGFVVNCIACYYFKGQINLKCMCMSILMWVVRTCSTWTPVCFSSVKVGALVR